MEYLDWIVENWEFLSAIAGAIGWLIVEIKKSKDKDGALEVVAGIIEDAKADPEMRKNAKTIATNIKGNIKPSHKKRLDKMIWKVRMRNGKK
jgi:hypothetical protein